MSLQDEQLYVLHPALRSDNGPSSAVFANINAPQAGSAHIFEDFERGVGGLEQKATTPAGSSIAGAGGSSDAYGVIKIASSTTADLTNAVATGSAGNLLALSKKTAFEVRFKKTDVSDDTGSVFLGLSATGLEPLAGSATHSLAADSVGFFVNATSVGNGNKVIFSAKGSSTQVDVDNLTAIADGTYIKLGFVYDPQASTRVKIFVNGVEQSSGLSSTNAEDGTKFPATTDYLDVSLAMRSSTAASEVCHVDWVQVVQEA